MNHLTDFDDAHSIDGCRNVYEDLGKRKSLNSGTVPEKFTGNVLGKTTRRTHESDSKEFKADHLDDGFGLMAPEETMTIYLGEGILSLDRLKDEPNLGERECQHFKKIQRTRAELENIGCYTLEGKTSHGEDGSNLQQKCLAFSEKSTDVKPLRRTGSTQSGGKAKFKDQASRQKYFDTKHLMSGEHFIDEDGNRPCHLSISTSDKTKAEIQDKNEEANALFLKLQSIGKLSSSPRCTDKNAVDTFDSRNSCTITEVRGWLLSSASPDEVNSKFPSSKNEVSQKQTSGCIPICSTMENPIKSIQFGDSFQSIPELQLNDVKGTVSQVYAMQEGNLKGDSRLGKTDEHKLVVPKEKQKSGEGRNLKVKKTSSVNAGNNEAGQGVASRDSKEHTTVQEEPQVIQKEASTSSKIQEKSDTQNMAKNEKTKIRMFTKTNEMEKKKLAIPKKAIGGTKRREAKQKEVHSSDVLNDEACARGCDVDVAITSPSCDCLPSLSCDVSRDPLLASTAGHYDAGSFKNYERKNFAQRKDAKKQFRLKIAEAKKTLREARLKAQEKTVANRFNDALKNHTEAKMKRAFIKESLSAKSRTPRSLEDKSPALGLVKNTFTNVSLAIINKEPCEAQEMRKVKADLDRAKVKPIKTKQKSQKKQYSKIHSAESQAKRYKSQRRKDMDTIERYEVEYMTSELRYFNMHAYAARLYEALTLKDEVDAKLRHELTQERQLAAQLARKQKQGELSRIRKEEKRRKLAEKENLEREKREREASELEKQRADAIERREHNLKLRNSFNNTVIATDISRSYTYSYFPLLKKPPVKDEKKPHNLKKVKARYMLP